MRPRYLRAIAATNADQSEVFLGGEPRPGPYTEGSLGLEEAQRGVWPSVNNTCNNRLVDLGRAYE